MADGAATLAAIRRLLLAILAIGLLGTGVELLLLEHTDGFWQWSPIALIALGLAAVAWQAARPSAVSTRVLQALMTLFVLSGAVGVLLHYRGNVEFELEMSPALGGIDLFREAMMGATPALAPGTMVVLGLLGLAYAYADRVAREQVAER
jgi:hypothetical protein